MTDYVRGQTVHFGVTFVDNEGAAYTPTAPIMVIEYPSETKGRTHTQLSLALDAGEWVASWDSGTAGRAGKVRWTVYSSAPSPKIANEGEFNLTANSANLVAV